MRGFAIAVLVCGLVGLTGCPRPSPQPATQPDQTDTGPGSSATSHASVKTTRLGTGTTEVFIYEPADPAPSTAPVIAFIHAFGAINPRAYGAWIKHMVLNGNIVIFPVYQTTLRDPAGYTPDALTALKTAFSELNNGSHVKPDNTKFAFVSHSLGGPIALNLAAVAQANGLPKPTAAFLANPGDGNSVVSSFPTLITDNYAQIPSTLHLIIIVGDNDTVVGTDTASKLYNMVPQIAAGQREVLEFHSDSHGDPPLVAGHGAPLAVDQSFDSGESLVSGNNPPPALADLDTSSNQIDAFDYNGYWRLSDSLFSLAFAGVAQGIDDGGVLDLSLGTWSDGTPVKPATEFLP